MPRRFLTAEDVRRSQAAEIVIDAETLVTPQTLEAAQAANVRIRTATGPYKEPAPDRSPDSERAMRTLPHLPEPNEEPTAGSSVIVTAVGKNRPGVLAEITAAIGEGGANIHDISQRIIAGFFHLIVVVELSPSTNFSEMKTRL